MVFVIPALFCAIAKQIVAKHGSQTFELPPAKRRAKTVRKTTTQRNFDF